MSVLFPKVQKPREWDYRPIYYDEEKEARKDRKLARLHRGAFREEHEKNMTELRKKKQSRLAFWLVLLGLLIVVFYVLL
jgi:anaerobic C4-dicarboxylate transporter